MKKKLLSILACPGCKGPLKHDARKKVLICEKEGVVYPVRDGIPVLLAADSRKLEK